MVRAAKRLKSVEIIGVGISVQDPFVEFITGIHIKLGTPIGVGGSWRPLDPPAAYSSSDVSPHREFPMKVQVSSIHCGIDGEKPILQSSWCRCSINVSLTTRGHLATDHVILNHDQVTWTTPELAPPLLTTTPLQREDVSALDRLNVHRCPTRRVFSGTGLELMTRQATIRYLYHSATAATPRIGKLVTGLSLGAAEDPHCRRGRFTLNLMKLKRSSVGVMWKLGEGSARAQMSSSSLDHSSK
ncbi:uncharacterized protein TNCV_36391 [Trichonephila clavipes]|nr:uncharacterized protein TNCV_36391 [Trichonephila clavipes]